MNVRLNVFNASARTSVKSKRIFNLIKLSAFKSVNNSDSSIIKSDSNLNNLNKDDKEEN